MERRRFHRVPFNSDAVLRQFDQVWATTIIDLSLKGALFTPPEDFTPDTDAAYTLCFRLEGQDHQIAMEGEIKRIEQNRIGFAARHLDIESATALRRLITLNLGDVQLANRDLEALLADAG